ncbi:MAG: XRE family transcriptional regulator [Thermotoga sp.]|nr:MAG: XRE family transcriptional regulator [Thermotoga sp.]
MMRDIKDIGRKLREVRKSKGIKLKDLAKEIGVTPSLISQIEHGKVSPSLSTLKKILDALGETLVSIFQEETIKEEAKYVVRRKERTNIIVSEALRYELLSTKNNILALFMVYLKPGEGSGKDFYSHEGLEAGIILQGKMEITVGDKVFVLEEGDSITYPCNLPHKWRNIGDKEAIGIWVVSPPTF